MKKAVIVGLVCVNVALLAVLMLGLNAPPAEGQGFLKTDYLIVTSKINPNTDGLFILDLAKAKLLGLRPDPNRKGLTVIRGRDLKADFKLARDRAEKAK